MDLNLELNFTLPGNLNFTPPANFTLPANFTPPANLTLPANYNFTLPTNFNFTLPANFNNTLPANFNFTQPVYQFCFNWSPVSTSLSATQHSLGTVETVWVPLQLQLQFLKSAFKCIQLTFNQCAVSKTPTHYWNHCHLYSFHSPAKQVAAVQNSLQSGASKFKFTTKITWHRFERSLPQLYKKSIRCLDQKKQNQTPQ